VLDLMMPRLDGWRLLERMERTVVWADVPVIVLTAFDARAGLPAGCHVLHKPVESAVLLDVAAALTGRAAGKVFAT
jgi:DNA-binding response OmpR family regulator